MQAGLCVSQVLAMVGSGVMLSVPDYWTTENPKAPLAAAHSGAMTACCPSTG
jgi:hypothetical protein